MTCDNVCALVNSHAMRRRGLEGSRSLLSLLPRMASVLCVSSESVEFEVVEGTGTISIDVLSSGLGDGARSGVRLDSVPFDSAFSMKKLGYL